MFRLWPSSRTSAHLYKGRRQRVAGYRDEVIERLVTSLRDAVLIALLFLKDIKFAWNLAHSLALESDDVWERLAKEYEKVDPLAVLPTLTMLVEHEPTEAGAQHYRLAARRLKRMRQLAVRDEKSTEVDDLVAEQRSAHRRRPRLQLEFDRVGLP